MKEFNSNNLHSYIRAFNASPDAPPLDIYVNGKSIAEDIGYKDFTNYVYILPGTYIIEIFPAGQTQNPIIRKKAAIPPGKAYTGAIAGRYGNYSLVAIPEVYNTDLYEAQSCLRFINLSPNSLDVNLCLSSGKEIFKKVSYKEYTGYRKIAVGKYHMEIKTERKGQVILVLPDIHILPGLMYSVYMIGLSEGKPSLEEMIINDNNRRKL